MFTGLVEKIGTVVALDPLDATSSGGGGTSLTIADCEEVLGDAQLGDSMCINGACLTITALESPSSFKVGVAPETLRRTNLGSLTQGSVVNLERSVRAATRMGGHFVQGHVDCTAEITRKAPDGNAFTFRFAPTNKSILRYVVEKGYITIDGASLTVTKVNDEEGWFEVMIIAYTQEKVVTARKDTGDVVNLETDMVGKYVEKSVSAYFSGGEGSQHAAPAVEKYLSNANRV